SVLAAPPGQFGPVMGLPVTLPKPPPTSGKATVIVAPHSGSPTVVPEQLVVSAAVVALHRNDSPLAFAVVGMKIVGCAPTRELAGPVAVAVNGPEPVFVQEKVTPPPAVQTCEIVLAQFRPGVPDAGGVGGAPTVGVAVGVLVRVGVAVVVGVDVTAATVSVTVLQVVKVVGPLATQAWLRIVEPGVADGLTVKFSVVAEVVPATGKQLSEAKPEGGTNPTAKGDTPAVQETSPPAGDRPACQESTMTKLVGFWMFWTVMKKLTVCPGVTVAVVVPLAQLVGDGQTSFVIAVAAWSSTLNWNRGLGPS